MPEVSVIIPIYNSEKYLHECLDSVINQTYKDIEIILVDDGSTDKSSSICDEYAKKDERIKVFHISNNGPSNARNIGIDNATGEYIVFQDSDDYIELNMIEDTVNEALKSDSDLVISGHKTFFEEERKKPIIVSFNKTVYTNRKDFLNDFYKYFSAIALRGKLYKFTIIKDKNIRFIKNLSLGEDLMFNSKYFSLVNRVSVMENTYYYYRLVKDSLLRQFNNDIFDLIKIYYDELKALLLNNNAFNNKNKFIIKNDCLKGCIGSICYYVTHKKSLSLFPKIMKVKELMNKKIVIDSIKYFNSTSIWEKILCLLIKNKKPLMLITIVNFKDSLKKMFPVLERKIL